MLRNLRDTEMQGPMLLHVVTQKGKGYAPAEASADKYHGVVKFNVITGEQVKAPPGPPSYTKVFANALIAEAEATSGSSRSTRRCPPAPGSMPSPRNSPTAASMSASPSSTPSPSPPAWRPRA